MSVIGLCSKCGGEVVSLKYHTFRHVTQFTPPKCSKCGAIVKKDLPIIQMDESAPTQQLLQE